MKVPQLKKKLEIKTCHNIDWEDNYSWIHQDNILEVLRDKSKLDPEVKKYLEDENAYSEHHLKDTKDIQKKLFDEIKGRIKLDDESLPYKDHTYEYWTKTTKIGNYSIIGEVVGIHINDEYIENGMFNTKKARPVARLGYMDYGVVGEENIFSKNRPKINSEGQLEQVDNWDGVYR